MFLAIINDTYADVKLEVMSRKSEFQVGDFFKTGLNNVKGYLGIIDRFVYAWTPLSLNIKLFGIFCKSGGIKKPY